MTAQAVKPPATKALRAKAAPRKPTPPTPTSRTLLSGRVVPEESFPKNLTISTKSPQKWAAVDLETGQIWMGEQLGWVQASEQVQEEIKAIVAPIEQPKSPSSKN